MVEHTKNPAPYIDPTLYDRPPEVPLATKAVMTSPAPLASARSVTAAKASGNFSHSEIQVIAGARYSSTTEEINLKIKKMMNTEITRKKSHYPEKLVN